MTKYVHKCIKSSIHEHRRIINLKRSWRSFDHNIYIRARPRAMSTTAPSKAGSFSFDTGKESLSQGTKIKLILLLTDRNDNITIQRLARNNFISFASKQ